jgi:hypothetical protein
LFSNLESTVIRQTTLVRAAGQTATRFVSFQAYPQKLGGWQKTTSETFIGVCRQVWNWITSFTDNFLGVGTDIKLYIEVGGQFYDITPLRATLTTPATDDVTFADNQRLNHNNRQLITAHGAACLGITLRFLA